MNHWRQKLAWTYYQCLEFAKATYFNLIPPLYSNQNQDMCHGTIDSDLVGIQSHPSHNLNPTWSNSGTL